jgi:hypothetical protein
MATSATLAKLARSHSIAMARESARHYRGACTGRALWHNDISKASSHDGVIWATVNVEQTSPGWRWPRGIL